MENITSQSSSLPLVVLFGRVNVGKSTLFNRLVEKNQALVSPVAGTTRDSNFGETEWRGRQFRIVDTGGVIDLDKLFIRKGQAFTIDQKVQKQIAKNLKKADLIFLVLDAKVGLTSEDRAFINILKKRFDEKKICLIVNKVESQDDRSRSAEFFKLGFSTPLAVSALTGSGIGDLLDLVIDNLFAGETKKKNRDEEEILPEIQSEIYQVCVLGQPNAGKSSLVNKILQEERMIVSDIPHTTREPQDSLIEYKNCKINLIDTAGLSKQEHKKSNLCALSLKKTLKEENLKTAGILKSLDSLNRSEIALLVIDIQNGLTAEDLKIADEILSKKKSFIIVANKWDLIEERDTQKYIKMIYSWLPFARWAPIQFISAKSGEKVDKLMDLILEVSANRRHPIMDKVELRKFLNKCLSIHKPHLNARYQVIRLINFEQTNTNPPEFSLKIKKKDRLNEAYIRFLENNIRKEYGLKGTPIVIKVVR